MFTRKAATLKSHALVLSLVLGPLWTSCKAELQKDGAKQISGLAGEGGGAFFALRSCHQRLGGDGGDFFSPDYVCANPPLWCNWTIRAPAGKRVHLHLQDLTPDEDCHLKQDQIHVDDSASQRVLRGCWRDATYASRSDTLRVVLLIGGWPAQQYRGFYARYRTFGPPVAFPPPDGVSGPGGGQDLQDWDEFGPMMAEGDRKGSPTAATDVFPVLDYSGKAADSSVEPDAPAQPPDSHDLKTRLATFTPSLESPHGTSRAERGAPRMLSDASDPTEPAHEHLDRLPAGSLHIPAAKRRDADQKGPSPPEDERHRPTEEAAQNKMEVTATSSSSEHRLPHPNVVEPLSDHRGKLWNASQVLHEPGDHLLEVSVEVQLSRERNRNQQEHLDESLIKSVKALVLQHLDGLHMPLGLTLKRIKRLRAGELYIMWLNMGRGRAFAGIHQDLHKMLGSTVGRVGNSHRGVVASVSVGDVNECGTQLSLCDVNADCLDQFGSYACRCKDGFRDESHLGPAGTVCVERKPAVCVRSPSGETKGVYVLFFLLSSLLLMPPGDLPAQRSAAVPLGRRLSRRRRRRRRLRRRRLLGPAAASAAGQGAAGRLAQGAMRGRGSPAAPLQPADAIRRLRGLTGSWQEVMSTKKKNISFGCIFYFQFDSL
ncbi:uncharacterized protein LOC144021154 isoform X2 [Festucalex cinctus]